MVIWQVDGHVMVIWEVKAMTTMTAMTTAEVGARARARQGEGKGRSTSGRMHCIGQGHMMSPWGGHAVERTTCGMINGLVPETRASDEPMGS